MPANPLLRIVRRHMNRCESNVGKQKFTRLNLGSIMLVGQESDKYTHKSDILSSLKRDGRLPAWMTIAALMGFFAGAAPHGCHPAKQKKLRRYAI
jgi:hypothetical protein